MNALAQPSVLHTVAMFHPSGVYAVVVVGVLEAILITAIVLLVMRRRLG